MLCAVQDPHLLLQLCRQPGKVRPQGCLQQVGSSRAAAALLQEVMCVWPQPGSSSSTVMLQLPGEASRRLPSAQVTLWVWPQRRVTETGSLQLTRDRSDLLRMQAQRASRQHSRVSQQFDALSHSVSSPFTLLWLHARALCLQCMLCLWFKLGFKDEATMNAGQR